MKRMLLALLVMGGISALAQNAFDGTWKLNNDTAQFKGDEKFSLQDGMWRCDTCTPKVNVKADGQDQKVSGSPYYDTMNVRAVDDHTVETTSKKEGKVASTNKRTASEDGKSLTSEWSFIAENGSKGSGKFAYDRVGSATAGQNKVSGTWRPRKVQEASESVQTFTYKVTADDISMSDPVSDSYTAKLDGKDYPYKGDPGITSVSLKKIDANTIEETDKWNGRVISVSRMTVSADGKTMKVAVEDKLHNASSNWTADKR